ncbi:Npun_F0494 family protein [Anabaena sp. CCY 9910]|uniref:Npun_F0494 family protein n=1 Tax=Anabaena sp. CCY 9910 TaxID=3103870 RepID=UPI0039E166F8
MPTMDSPTPKAFSYPQTTVERARRSLICSPFNIGLFATMRSQSVSLGAIANEAGVKNGYTKNSLLELTCDNELDWLIQVGLLRREVDGQGITDSFRLTPLGHQLIEQYQGKNLPAPSWRDRLYDIVIRWFRLPF